jgi:hypothetical protein
MGLISEVMPTLVSNIQQCIVGLPSWHEQEYNHCTPSCHNCASGLQTICISQTVILWVVYDLVDGCQNFGRTLDEFSV